MDAEHETEELVPKKGAGSVVWRFFGFQKSDVDQTTILCKCCRAKIQAKGGNTSNLLQHLSRKHVLEYQECMILKSAPSSSAGNTGKPKEKSSQMSLTDVFARGTFYDRKSKRWIEITNSITNHIAKDMVPLITVEKDGFKQMIKTLDPRYEMQSRKYFSQVAIPNLYQKHRATLETDLATVHHFAATTDLWSSRTMEPYLSLTVHFISEEWVLQSHCLQTSYFPNDHTGEFLAAGLKEAFDSWGLSEQKLVAITTDSGANIKKAIELNNWTRLQCFGHRLHLAIETAMKDDRIQRAVGVCKRIVSAFSYSWKKRRDLAIVQNDLGLPKHVLTTEMPTRWGSRQMMIKRVLEQERAISQLLKADKKSRHLVLSWQDVDVLEEIVLLIKAQQDTLSGAAGAAEAEPVPPPEEKRKKTLASFFKRQSTTSNSTLAVPDDQSIRMELTVYLQTTEVDSDTDPLDWWRCHQTNFPRIAKLAQQYLCIPATSAPSERVFSTGGNIVTCHRAALKPDAVDRLVFLAKNL
ncbi:E3 SUMO-protein ligase ZBED1-like [Paramisgurnus dabryanus]|uniref:E3 SUMO-protein ligase ZBED1-like n=1 Tax=Paramisgurnus dabryanus TaxID=90735 RepID=UPI003CCF7321